MSAEFTRAYLDFPQELVCSPGPAPWPARTAWLPMTDGALVWYSDTGGAGQPLVLVHGWMMSSRIWRKNAAELAKNFRVVTVDFRGHGSSSKVLHGHTLARYAQDLREVILHLRLARPALAGWSLGGVVVMEYWRQFGNAASVLALALIDSSLGPFADGDWNAFRMKSGKMDDMTASFRAMRADPEGFARTFNTAMFKDPPREEDLAWLCDETSKTPPWIASAIHSDFGMHNYEPLLPGVTVSGAVFSGVFFSEKNLAMGEHFASRMPKGRYFKYADAGHLLFFEQPERFNRELTEFVLAAKKEGEGLVNPTL